MLKCEGYMMFRGSAAVKYRNGKTEKLRGTWLYRPDNNMWYLADCPQHPWGISFYPEDLSDIAEAM